MNPFTRFLKQWTHDRDLETFVEHCDALEALIVRVYKRKEATGADEAEYQALRRWMKAHYGGWRHQLRPFIPAAGRDEQAAQRAEGLATDPFEAMFSVESASDFVGAWHLMQQLPNAREALNRLIMELSDAGR